MQSLTSDKLFFPIEPYVVPPGILHFGQRVRSRVILWARHLGDDVIAEPGTSVVAIGRGEVVWAEMRLGTQAKRNWGGIVVVAHGDKRQNTEHTTASAAPRSGGGTQNTEFVPAFYSVYGHLTDLAVKVGDTVQGGQQLGVVAPGRTPENGWWKTPHLHFGIYVGPWRDQVLPGYLRPFEGRTKFAWWREPKPFIEAYNKASSQ